jgi:hypothetical protein
LPARRDFRYQGRNARRSSRKAQRFQAYRLFGLVTKCRVKSDASQEPARHRLSLWRRRFVVTGLFHCVTRRRSLVDEYFVTGRKPLTNSTDAQPLTRERVASVDH